MDLSGEHCFPSGKLFKLTSVPEPFQVRFEIGDPVSHHRRPRVLVSGIQCLLFKSLNACNNLSSKPLDSRSKAYGNDGEEVQWRQHSAFGSYNRLTTV